jgi:probable phosphoglycerate mutase
VTTIYWVRHGENRANLTKEFSHRLVDYPLTAKGRLQALQTGVYFSSMPIAAIYASPLRRAVETAEAIASPHGLVVQVVEDFREVNVGDLEKGPITVEAWAENERIFRAWLDGNLQAAFPGGENYLQLLKRMRRGYRHVLRESAGQQVVIVAHGGNFISTLRNFCPDVDLGWLLSQESHNCSISRLEMDIQKGRIQGRLVEWAYAGHLTGEAADLVSGILREGEALPSIEDTTD